MIYNVISQDNSILTGAGDEVDAETVRKELFEGDNIVTNERNENK